MSSAGPRRLAWGAPTSWRRCRVRRTLPWHIHRPPCWWGTGGREPHLRPRRCARGRSSSWPDAVDPHAGSGSLPWRAQDLRVPRPSGRDAVPHHDACPASRGRHGTGQPTRREDRPLPTHAARRCPPRNGEWSCCAPIKAPMFKARVSHRRGRGRRWSRRAKYPWQPQRYAAQAGPLQRSGPRPHLALGELPQRRLPGPRVCTSLGRWRQPTGQATVSSRCRPVVGSRDQEPLLPLP